MIHSIVDSGVFPLLWWSLLLLFLFKCRGFFNHAFYYVMYFCFYFGFLLFCVFVVAVLVLFVAAVVYYISISFIYTSVLTLPFCCSFFFK